MILHAINQIKKRDIPLQYRSEYSGMADVELTARERTNIPFIFSVEIESTGSRKIRVRLSERIDYPSLPIIRALKGKIMKIEKNGELP